ncbi:MAG: PPC domain-containing protein, partial [Verrucomicrobiota bacterium]
RELRLATPRGVSNPLSFMVGQVPESSRKPMISATLQVLGKEASALRKRPPEEAERSITLPCTVNGQIASGEVNRYRFQAKKGQRLVISTLARQLIPYVADAVPGWFQPVLALYDANGKEQAYVDDYQFKPDPVILFEVPKDGEYVCAIRDAIYRGREDFVYRITIGEMPFITGIFPLGGPLGAARLSKIPGWGLSGAKLDMPPANAGPGVVEISANKAGLVSNRVPFELDRLPEVLEKEPNNKIADAQQITLPVIINGRIEKPDDGDVFCFTGKANDPVVIEVRARRLDSPLDSVIKLTDATGKVIAFNDDCEDLTAGTNTHHADSYLMTQLPADGNYFVHIGDTARHSGEEYSYRLRISAPRPDFELRVVPSSASFAIKTGATVSVYAVRKDGFTGPIKLTLKNPPPEFTAGPVTIPENQPLAKFYFKGSATPTTTPVELSIVGSAMLGTQEATRDAVPAEDRMQAFLWRHLVPANDLKVLVYDPKIQPQPKHPLPFNAPPFVGPPSPGMKPPARPADVTTPASGTPAVLKPKFTAQQIVGRLKQLKILYEDGLLTDSFYEQKVTECETDL